MPWPCTMSAGSSSSSSSSRHKLCQPLRSEVRPTLNRVLQCSAQQGSTGQGTAASTALRCATLPSTGCCGLTQARPAAACDLVYADTACTQLGGLRIREAVQQQLRNHLMKPDAEKPFATWCCVLRAIDCKLRTGKPANVSIIACNLQHDLLDAWTLTATTSKLVFAAPPVSSEYRVMGSIASALMPSPQTTHLLVTAATSEIHSALYEVSGHRLMSSVPTIWKPGGTTADTALRGRAASEPGAN
jgi:hypothetical protein